MILLEKTSTQTQICFSMYVTTTDKNHATLIKNCALDINLELQSCKAELEAMENRQPQNFLSVISIILC